MASIHNAKHILLSGIQTASRLKEKTHKGELLYINIDLETVFIVKPDANKLWVVTVLSLAQHEEWEAKRQAEIEEASNLLLPLRKHFSNEDHYLQTVINRLKEKNKRLALETKMLQSELAQFRKEERKALYKNTKKT